jgi:hypothetical protein
MFDDNFLSFYLAERRLKSQTVIGMDTAIIPTHQMTANLPELPKGVPTR